MERFGVEGTNYSGQLGAGDKLQRYTPVLLPTPSIGVAKIFAGSTTSFLIDNNGKVWAAGANATGQLGTGDLNPRTSFVQLPFFDNKSIDLIIPRLLETGFRETNGKMWNVGDNVRGLIGLGNTNGIPYTTPVALPGFTTTMLAGYGQTAYALKADGSLWSWGSNSSGALGTGGGSTDTSSPIQIK